MSKYTLTNFGEIDTDNLEEYYDAEIFFNGWQIEVEIAFDEKSINIDKLEKINQWLATIQKLDELGITTMKEDFEKGGNVKEYIEHHLEELDSDDIETLISKVNVGTTKEEKMLSSIKLKRIGFYPQTVLTSYFIVFIVSGYYIQIGLTRNHAYSWRLIVCNAQSNFWTTCYNRRS